MPHRRSKRRPKAVPIIGVIVALLVVAGGIAYAVKPDKAVPHAGRIVGYTPAPSDTPPAPKTSAHIADVVALLRTRKPVTVSVLGDSTGNDPYEWVYLWAQTMGKRFDRTVRISTVNATTNVYPPLQTLAQGGRGTLTVWNASIPGASPARETPIARMLAPKTPADVVFINHGHNGLTQHIDDDAGNLVTAALATSPKADVVVIGQNPELGTPDRDARQAYVVSTLEKWATGAGYDVIDVYKPFAAAPNEQALFLPGGVHATVKGALLWGQIVSDRFR